MHVASDLTQEQIDALRIADNQTGALSEFDRSMLGKAIAELPTFDWEKLGFTTAELESLSIESGDAVEDPWSAYNQVATTGNANEVNVKVEGDRVNLRVLSDEGWQALKAAVEERGGSWPDDGRKPKLLKLP